MGSTWVVLLALRLGFFCPKLINGFLRDFKKVPGKCHLFSAVILNSFGKKQRVNMKIPNCTFIVLEAYSSRPLTKWTY